MSHPNSLNDSPASVSKRPLMPRQNNPVPSSSRPSDVREKDPARYDRCSYESLSHDRHTSSALDGHPVSVVDPSVMYDDAPLMYTLGEK